MARFSAAVGSPTRSLRVAVRCTASSALVGMRFHPSELHRPSRCLACVATWQGGGGARHSRINRSRCRPEHQNSHPGALQGHFSISPAACTLNIISTSTTEHLLLVYSVFSPRCSTHERQCRPGECCTVGLETRLCNWKDIQGQTAPFIPEHAQV